MRDAVTGSLASYGASRADLWRRAVSHVRNIMRGVKLNDLPVEQLVRFKMVINLKTAKAIRLDMPPSLLMRANKVIE